VVERNKTVFERLSIFVFQNLLAHFRNLWYRPLECLINRHAGI